MSEVDIDYIIKCLQECLGHAHQIKEEGENEDQDVPSLIEDIVDTFKYMNCC